MTSKIKDMHSEKDFVGVNDLMLYKVRKDNIFGMVTQIFQTTWYPFIILFLKSLKGQLIKNTYPSSYL